MLRFAFYELIIYGGDSQGENSLIRSKNVNIRLTAKIRVKILDDIGLNCVANNEKAATCKTQP